MAKAKMTVAKAPTKTAKKAKESASVPSLLGLALLIGLLAILPWMSDRDGSAAWRALQLSTAILLAIGGGICLGMQIASKKKA